MRRVVPLSPADVRGWSNVAEARNLSLPGRHCTWPEPEGLPRCVDCDSTGGNCTPLAPRGRCRAVRRFYTEERSVIRHQKDGAIYTRQTHQGGPPFTEVTFEAPLCAGLSPPCFDLRRCSSGPLKVFVHPGVSGSGDRTTSPLESWLDAAAMDRLVVRVHDPHAACLLLVHVEQLHGDARNLVDADVWRGGANHMLWQTQADPKWHRDKPGLLSLDPGLAALASSSLRFGHRPGYDMPTLELPQWRPSAAQRAAIRHEPLGRPRRLLLGFKGSIAPLWNAWYQHRWVAAEFLHAPADRVVIDVRCEGLDGLMSGYCDCPRVAYDELLLHSTFAFTPGGGGPHSYRFTEALLAGAIPVVTNDLLLPFEPEVRDAI